MKPGHCSKGLSSVAGAAVFVLLAGCVNPFDPLSRPNYIRLTNPNLALSVCGPEQHTRYTVVSVTKDGVRREQSLKVKTAEGQNHPVFKASERTIRKELSWVRFTVYCGESAIPVLVTPRITHRELYEKWPFDFYYLVE